MGVSISWLTLSILPVRPDLSVRVLRPPTVRGRVGVVRVVRPGVYRGAEVPGIPQGKGPEGLSFLVKPRGALRKSTSTSRGSVPVLGSLPLPLQKIKDQGPPGSLSNSVRGTSLPQLFVVH